MATYIPAPPVKEPIKPKKSVKSASDIFSGKREIINGYVLEKGFTTKNSGFSRWGFADKNGEEYFIKEFLSPVFPDSPYISESIKKRRIEICKEWYAERQKVFKAISNAATGNIVVVKDFFKFGNKFYEVTDKINGGISIDDISDLPLDNKIMLLKVLAHCLKGLNQVKIVHADLKADNIIVKRTASETYTAKIIDISDSYFESNPPESSDDIKGDFVYLAPETFLRMIDKDAILTTKVDVFALGIIFHQYMCGKTPSISDNYQYVYEAVLNDETPVLDSSIPADIRTVIEGMLKKELEDRMSIDEVFEELSKIKMNIKPSPPILTPPTKPEPTPAENDEHESVRTTRLKIRMGRR